MKKTIVVIAIILIELFSLNFNKIKFKENSKLMSFAERVSEKDQGDPIIQIGGGKKQD